MSKFRDELEALLRYNQTGSPYTSDFIAATFLTKCLTALDEALEEQRKQQDYGKTVSPPPANHFKIVQYDPMVVSETKDQILQDLVEIEQKIDKVLDPSVEFTETRECRYLFYTRQREALQTDLQNIEEKKDDQVENLAIEGEEHCPPNGCQAFQEKFFPEAAEACCDSCHSEEEWDDNALIPLEREGVTYYLCCTWTCLDRGKALPSQEMQQRGA
jgi:hypothetical protein